MCCAGSLKGAGLYALPPRVSRSVDCPGHSVPQPQRRCAPAHRRSQPLAHSKPGRAGIRRRGGVGAARNLHSPARFYHHPGPCPGLGTGPGACFAPGAGRCAALTPVRTPRFRVRLISNTRSTARLSRHTACCSSIHALYPPASRNSSRNSEWWGVGTTGVPSGSSPK